MRIIRAILIGFVAGSLAGKVTSRKNDSFWGNVASGVAGSLIGHWLFGLLGIGSYRLVGEIVIGTVGAIIFDRLTGR